jgi:hypothetical protein
VDGLISWAGTTAQQENIDPGGHSHLLGLLSQSTNLMEDVLGQVLCI